MRIIIYIWGFKKYLSAVRVADIAHCLPALAVNFAFCHSCESRNPLFAGVYPPFVWRGGFIRGLLLVLFLEILPF